MRKLFLPHINNSTTNEISKKFLTVVHIIIHRTFYCKQVTFPIKLYQPEEDPTVGQISDKDEKSQTRNKLILHFFKKNKNRSSRSEVCCKKGVLRKFSKFTGKHLCQSLYLNKVACLRPATLFKKRLWHRCFPVSFAKFLRTPFLTEHLRWLLL